MPTRGSTSTRTPTSGSTRRRRLTSAATMLPLALGLAGNMSSPTTSTAPPVAHHGKSTACRVSLSSCPVNGCEEEGTPHALVNEIKRSLPPSGTPKNLTWDDFTALQQDADSTVGQDTELDADARSRLHNLSVSIGRVSEGDLVQLAG